MPFIYILLSEVRKKKEENYKELEGGKWQIPVVSK